MKIDPNVERLTREAFAASVAGEADRFDAALVAIADQGDETTSHALALALAVDRIALFAIHDGQRPDENQMAYLAGGLAEDAQTWAPDAVTRQSARSFLDSIADVSTTTLEPGDLALHAFGTGGWLLSSFQSSGKKWTEFLDQILDTLESVEEPRQ